MRSVGFVSRANIAVAERSVVRPFFHDVRKLEILICKRRVVMTKVSLWRRCTPGSRWTTRVEEDKKEIICDGREEH